MSLNWDARNTEAYADLLERQADDPDAGYSDDQHNTLDMLIWGSLLLDMRGIRTANDAEEFVFRARFAKEIGVWAYNRVPTLDELQEWIGLSTNVSQKTRHQYVTSVAKQIRTDVESAMRYEARERADA